MNDKTQLKDFELDDLFETARNTAPVPSADLVARMMADADAELSANARAKSSSVPVKRGLFAGILTGIGGWPAVAGLATATVAGVMIGAATPDTLDALDNLSGGYLASVTGYELDDLVPSLGDLLVEG